MWYNMTEHTKEQQTEQFADIRVDFGIYYPILPTAINVMNILIEKGYMDPDAFIYAVRPSFSKLSRKKSDFFYSWTSFLFIRGDVMRIIRQMIRKNQPRKYMKSDLSLEQLLKNRNALRNQISLLKTQYLRHDLSRPTYYKKFEHVALEMIQINQRIKEELPLFDVLNLA